MFAYLLEHRPSGRVHRSAAWAACLLLAAGALTSCASDPDPVTQMPVVIPRKQPGAPGGRNRDRAPGLSAESALEMLGAASDLRRAEDYDKALEVLNRLAARDPPRSVLEDLQRLRMDVKRHLLQSVYVDALVVLDRDRITLGNPITGQLVLVNLSRETLVIPSSTKFESPRHPPERKDRFTGRTLPVRSETTISEDLRYLEYVADGTLIRQNRTRSRRVGEDLVLQSGERMTWPLKFDSLAYSPLSVAMREYTFTATLFPADIRVGEESFPGTLEFRPAVCRVFPRNYQGLQKNPLTSLYEAIDKQSPPHIPLAAALVPEAERPKAVQEIRSYLMNEKHVTLAGPARAACCVALRLLTGWNLPADPELWIDQLKIGAPPGNRR